MYFVVAFMSRRANYLRPPPPFPPPPWDPPPKLDRPRDALAIVAPPWLKPLNAPERVPAWLCDAVNPCCDPADALEDEAPWNLPARFIPPPPWLKLLRFANVVLWETYLAWLNIIARLCQSNPQWPNPHPKPAKKPSPNPTPKAIPAPAR